LGSASFELADRLSEASFGDLPGGEKGMDASEEVAAVCFDPDPNRLGADRVISAQLGEGERVLGLD
jgi:hypothetical protein